MGYTHYWTFKKPAKGQAAKTEQLYQKAIRDCQLLIRAFYNEHGGLSGYSAHTKLGAYGGILVNGKGDDGHEDFSLREHYSQNLEQNFNFCKTAQKPYDVVVVACLAILKHRLSDLIEVSSDGDNSEWTDGVILARQVTKLKIKNPIKSRFDLECPYCGKGLNIDFNNCCGESGHGVNL